MNRKSGIPCFYFPTQTLFIDDSQRFLETITFAIDPSLAYLTFTNHLKALDYLKKQNKINDLINELLTENVESQNFGISRASHETTLNFEPLINLIHNKDRFNQPAVVVVDYLMPDISGLQLCEEINGGNIKKIMLTGEADESVAIKAFNEGIINRFMSKKSLILAADVSNAIKMLQYQFFCEISQPILNNLLTHQDCALGDKAFIEFFRKIREENEIVEFYLIDNIGSFLLLKDDGTPLWLLVTTENELRDYYEVASDQKASKSILDVLKARKKLPYFSSVEQYMNATNNQWEAYLYPCEKFEGDQTYYYSLVKDKSVQDFHKEQIYSYRQYLNNLAQT